MNRPIRLFTLFIGLGVIGCSDKIEKTKQANERFTDTMVREHSGWSLRTALNFPDDIDATVMYYGQLETNPEELKKLTMPLLGIFDEEDQGIPLTEVKRFEAVLDSLGIDASINIYPNANHAL